MLLPRLFHPVVRCLLIVGFALSFIGPSPIVAKPHAEAPHSTPPELASVSIDPALVTNPMADAGIQASASAVITATQPAEEGKPLVPAQPIGPTAPPSPHTIHLKSRDFVPGVADARSLQQLARSDQARVHVLVQLDFVPREAAKLELEKRGLKLLTYVPDYAWIASIPAKSPDLALQLPGVTWAGELTANDKLDPAIQSNEWMSFNLAPDGTAAVYVVTQLDEDMATTRSLIEKYGGKVTGEVQGIKMLMVEMPRDNIRALAAEDVVQWIEPAEPILREANDGIRQQIGVDTVQAAPYNLTGSGVDILIYDVGVVTATHPDFSGRLTIGAGEVSGVADHSTHVAGIAAGSGSLSASAGGTALQWRGMAPGADLISYAYNWNGQGMLFYNNPGDIENNWAAAQNTYGADIGNASLGSNIYANYPLSCTLMGNYGVTAALLDQMIRGGNAVVGVGDKYITTWANGNERGSASSCGTYNTIAPPASAKNPIQVGASDKSNNMSTFSSWGPTDDGRLKPIVVATGVNIKSTIPNMFTNTSTRNCDGSGDDYCYPYDTMSGTSMAAPAVAGSIALMLQHYRAVYNTTGNFWPSTAKAILMQTANDLGNPGPDYQWGYGLVDIHAAVDLISRRAFRQDSVAAGGTDVFYMIVPTSTAPLQVSLAWDDYEATFNANPTLINNLDLELEAPSGTIWRPWILNAASPANNATRGVNTVDNQEQATVPSPEIGTWIVRVKGTTVPQGPQDYSLACEGCKPLDAGVCQSKVSTAVMSLPSMLEGESGALSRPIQVVMPELLTAGEQWQRSLEQPIVTQQPDDQSQLIEQARRQGDEAVVALRETLTGEARDRAMDDIVAAQQRLADAAPPPPETRPISAAEEQARLESQRAAEIANRAQAFTSFDDPKEGQSAPAGFGNPADGGFGNPPRAATADLTVGNSCTYATIAAAITAANSGDRVLIEGGRTFTENLTVNKNLTLQGGYNGCASGSSARTTIDGNNASTVVVVNAGLTVTLQSLNLTNGNYSGEGGGIRFAYGGTGLLTLTNVDIYSNTAQWGGGIWVGQNAAVAGTGVNIYNNTANTYGGGLRLFGSSATLNYGNIYNNIAPLGGGVYATKETGAAPALDLPHSADLYSNHSITGIGLGGGLYLREGSVSLADCSDIYSNNAIGGGGAYLITSTLTINGSCSEIDSNTANANGGGVYAQGSSIVMQDQVELLSNTAGATTTANGGGAYLDNSSLYSYRSAIYYNTTSYDGGGVYAANGSVVYATLGSYPCAGLHCSQIAYNAAGSGVGFGGAIRADNSYIYLYNTFVENNTADFGGGLYLASNTTGYVYNSLFARNNATGGTGDGIRLNAASLYGTNNTLAYNDASGASTGRAIDMASSNLSLGCSIVWGHASGIDATGQSVTYSDIQGGYGNSTNLNVDPLFVAAGSQDYHLRGNSPVIDRCVSGQSNDFENEPRPIVRTAAAAPYDMGADEVSGVDRVGVNGTCSYGTLQQAVNAANDGDTIRVAAGVYFENVGITAGKVITIEGGYNNTCTSTGAGATRIDGSAGYNTFYLYNGTTKLRNLQVAWGSGTGGGMDVVGSAQVTLDGVEVFNNHGDYGGGIWLDTGSAVTITNGSTVHDNTATSPGGGVRAWGKFYGYGTTSDIYNNCAPDGGGFSVPGGQVYLDNADVIGNQAAGATGKGGGIYVEAGGSVTLTNSVFVGEAAPQMNTAYDGGGIYADNATVLLEGSATTVVNNTASHDGGGVYLVNNGLLRSTGANIGHTGLTSWGNDAQLGAGIYAITSTINFAGKIINNIAAYSGAGIYATASAINLTGATVGGTGVNEANQLGALGHEGVGLFLTNNTHATLSNTVVSSNTFQSASYLYGGGALVDAGSVLTLTNSRVERHLAPDTFDGRGAGLYVRNATVTLDNSQIISNTAGAVGGGVRLFGGTLNVTHGSSLINNQTLAGMGGAIAATYDASAPDINISNATLQHNTASGNGGAIYLDAGTLDTTGWWDFRWNNAGGSGGAVAVVSTGDADFSVTGGAQPSLLAVNSASGNGGALYVTNNDYVTLYATNGYPLNLNTNSAGGNGGAAYADNGATFDFYGQVQASSNAASGNGGVFYISGGSRAWLDDYINIRPQIWSNQATNGGVVYAQAGSFITCDGADIGTGSVNGSSALTGSGGAFYLSGSTLAAKNCVFRNNQAALNGGAIAAYTSTLAINTDYPTLASVISTVDRLSPNAPQATTCNPLSGQCSSFANNKSDSDANSTGDGGAIYLNASSMQLNNTYLQRNHAQAGVIYQTGASSVSTIANSLVYSNTLTNYAGGGIRNQGGIITMTHVTLANNIGSGFSTGVLNSFAYNSIAYGNSVGGFNGTLSAFACNIDQSLNGGPNLNPQFVAAGAGENYHLHLGSPAADACADAGVHADLDGYARPLGSAFDMGAYESFVRRLYLPVALK